MHVRVNHEQRLLRVRRLLRGKRQSGQTGCGLREKMAAGNHAEILRSTLQQNRSWRKASGCCQVSSQENGACQDFRDPRMSSDFALIDPAIKQ
jgi:hypothetical protein